MPAPAQEWLRWQETPLSSERDPGKRAPPSPQPEPAMQEPVELVPLRKLATPAASQPTSPVEQARESAARPQAAAGAPPSPPPQPDPTPPMRIAKAGHIVSVARSQPTTASVATPVVGRLETAAIFALQRARYPAIATLRISDLDPRFAPSQPAAPKMWSMAVAKQTPIPFSPIHLHRPPLLPRVSKPRIAPPATAGSAPAADEPRTIAPALRIDDSGARLARPQTASLALPSPASPEVPGIRAAATPADDTAALPPCVLRMRRASAAGATGIAYLPRNEASKPCPAAVDAVTLEAQRGSGGGGATPQPAVSELLRNMLRGR